MGMNMKLGGFYLRQGLFTLSIKTADNQLRLTVVMSCVKPPPYDTERAFSAMIRQVKCN